MKKKKQLSANDAKRIGDSIYLDWDQVDLEQFRQGLMGKRKHSAMNSEADLKYESVLLTGRTVLAHMQEFPDYFTRLAQLKAEVDQRRARRTQRKQMSV